MRIFVFVLVIFSSNVNSFAQSEVIRRSSLQLMGGAINTRMVDTGLSFNRQSFIGTSFKFYSAYERMRVKNMLLASFEINGGKLTMDGERVVANVTNGQISASYLAKVSSYDLLSKKSTLYVGPKLSSVINYLQASQLDNETLLAIYGLYLHVVQQTQLSASNFLDVGLTLPAVAYTKRLVLDGGLYSPANEETINILLDDGVFSLGKMMEASATWSKRLTPHTYVSFRYRFAYVANTEFGDFKFYSNEVLAGLRFYFKNE